VQDIGQLGSAVAIRVRAGTCVWWWLLWVWRLVICDRC